MARTHTGLLTLPEAVRERLSEEISTLHPANFAMSMATGIVSISCRLLGLSDLSEILFGLNLIMYAALWVATIARACFFPDAFLKDWSSHQRAPGFFTSVAATCVLGVQFIVFRNSTAIGAGLWWFGLLLWVLCTYGVFVSLSILEEKPSLADGINGGWLLAVVATQSITVLGCKLLPSVTDREVALFVLLAFWLCGGMLYIWMISLIFYRYTFSRFLPTDLMPPYWINMGAVAISTLAGATLLASAGNSQLMASIAPFVKGFTILYWATATWWIPMLVVLGIWRHVIRRVAFVYDPLYWGLVFPLGMYCVSTFRIIEVFNLPYLGWISRGFVMIALVAWLFTFFGLTTRLLYVIMSSLRDLSHAASTRGSQPSSFLSSTANSLSHGGPQ